MKVLKALLIAAFLLCLSFNLQAQQKQAKPTIAVFHLENMLSEGHREPTISDIVQQNKEPKTFMSLINRLRLAAKSSKVKSCVFYGESIGLGLAQIEELRLHIDALNKAGKQTYFYSRGLDQRNLLVAGSCNKTIIFPESEVLINGLFLQNMYFKNLLDKLGLEADVIHIGDFKSAGEPFYLTAPSKESKAQSKRLYDDIYEQLLSLIASGRNKSVNQIKQLINKAVFSSAEAKEAGLVDALAYHKDFVDSLKKKYGANAHFDTKFGMAKKDKLQVKSLLDIFSLIQKMSRPPLKDTMDKISLTVIEGTINGKMGEDLRLHILKQARDKTVKAMVLRVNSPGGSALASEVICQALIEFKQTGKPLIVTMGNVAASGGYYVAAYGDTVLAENLTITGSIGVVGGKLVIGGLLEKAGISVHSYKLGKHADIMTTSRKFNDAERKILLKSFKRVYKTFKHRVSEGRQGKIKGDLENIAGGRVYTGSQALKIGLIDRIGGLRDAIDIAKDKAGLKKYKISMYPKQVTLESMITKELRDKPEEDDYVYTQSNSNFLQSALTKNGIEAQITLLQKLDPRLAANFRTFLQQLQLLANKEVLLISPAASFQ